ncbi:aldo/keto reductase [Actinomadura madurae]|uniref:aldo/keto reductase n=1 Tax=Actinomadura madurae TaxID=1993 RepID=UPI000D950E8F|nr:aldo/keto reductase [Actinomadura madurae]SPT51235.1 putative aldo-keto reductase [Actinomadura madurae]
MEYTRLGRSGLVISRLGLGTMNFGWRTEPTESFQVMDLARESGITLFDTADIYGWAGNEGRSEEILGDWFAARPGSRHEIVLATKVYEPMGPGHNDRGLSARHIRQALDASLRRLRTDHIDLYQFHHVDRRTPWEEIWQAVDVAVAQGKVLYVGSSNFAGWHIAEAQATAASAGLPGLVSEQSIYNLLERTVELEVIPAADRFGLGLLPWSPLHGGLLSGILDDVASGKRRPDGPGAQSLEKHRTQVEHYEKLARDIGTHPAELALAWLMSRPGVTAPIIGPRTADHLRDLLGATSVDVSAPVTERLDEIFPGHRPAPEDYAW